MNGTGKAQTHLPKMMDSQPVVVTKMFPSLLASSMVVTSYPETEHTPKNVLGPKTCPPSTKIRTTFRNLFYKLHHPISLEESHFKRLSMCGTADQAG